MLIPALLAFALALACSLLYGPIVRAWALRIGLTDNPDGNRKKQKDAVALGGGLVVFLSLSTVIALVLVLPNPWKLDPAEDWRDILGFGVACTIVVLVGLFDDRFGLRGRHKLIGQMVAAGCLMSSGLVIDGIGMFGWYRELGLLSIPFTMFWLLGAMNAINLLDGIDGLATLLGIILISSIAAMAAMKGNYAVAAVALVLTGSLTGFLRYNLPPARMYLGDAGSMLIGLMVGAMSIRAMLKGPGTVLLAAPLAILAIPILDAGAAVLRRRLSGRSIYSTDRGHLHHRLLEALGSNSKVLIVVGVCCLVTSAGALSSVIIKSEIKGDLFALITSLAVVVLLVITGAFGRAELRLLLSRLLNLGASFGHPTHVGGAARQSMVRLQGKQKWEVLWETLTESADKLLLSRVHLDVNAPALHESYIATWTNSDASDLERRWRLELPLSVGEMRVGRLDISGLDNGGSGLDEIAQLLDLLEPFNARLAALTNPVAMAEPELAETAD